MGKKGQGRKSGKREKGLLKQTGCDCSKPAQTNTLVQLRREGFFFKKRGKNKHHHEALMLRN